MNIIALTKSFSQEGLIIFQVNLMTKVIKLFWNLKMTKEGYNLPFCVLVQVFWSPYIKLPSLQHINKQKMLYD